MELEFNFELSHYRWVCLDCLCSDLIGLFKHKKFYFAEVVVVGLALDLFENSHSFDFEFEAEGGDDCECDLVEFGEVGLLVVLLLNFQINSQGFQDCQKKL